MERNLQQIQDRRLLIDKQNCQPVVSHSAITPGEVAAEREPLSLVKNATTSAPESQLHEKYRHYRPCLLDAHSGFRVKQQVPGAINSLLRVPDRFQVQAQVNRGERRVIDGGADQLGFEAPASRKGARNLFRFLGLPRGRNFTKKGS
jgi:hypothetical protein